MCIDLLANMSAPNAGAVPCARPCTVTNPHADAAWAATCPIEHTAGLDWQEPPSLPAAAIATTGAGRSSIPGPRPPLIGWQPRLIPILRDPVVGMLNLQRRYGNIVAFGQSPSAPVLVFGPEYNHQLLADPDLFYNLDVNSSVSPIRMPQHTAAARLLSGVAGMNGEKHTHHRRLLMPAFHKKRVEMLRDTMAACVEAHLAGWHAGKELDLVDEMVELSLSLAVSGLLGLSPGEEGHRVHGLLRSWGRHALLASVQLLPFDLPGFPYRRFLKLSERLEAEFRAVIARKRSGVGAAEATIDGGDALSILLDAQASQGAGVGDRGSGFAGDPDPRPPTPDPRSLTDTELMGHLTTLFTAGYETSAAALTWTLFLLSQHPQVMHDLMDELDGALRGGPPTLDQMGRLPLLEGVINESLRLFPPGTWMLRTSTAPFAIGPYQLPAGTHLVFSPAVTHRQPDLYPQPNRFLPGRWATIKPSTYQYLPFGGGPRRCLGATFALMELKVALPMILQRSRLQVPDGTRVDRGGTILSFPKQPLPIRLHTQDRGFAPALIRGNIHDLLDLN